MAVSKYDNQIQDQINDLNSKLKDIVIRRFVTKENVNFPANSGTTVDFPFSVPVGYKFLSVHSGNSNNSTIICNNAYVNTGTDVVHTVYRNTSSSAITVTVQVVILFIRDI